MTSPFAAPLPSPDLPGADWADRQHVLVAGRVLTAGEAVRAALGGEMPGWVSFLMRLRNRIVAVVGLKGAGPGAELDPARSIGGFPVVSETPSKVILGFDDWHLDFRIVVEAVPAPQGMDVSISTLVKRKHWFGKLYIFLITPFHVLIVRRSIKTLVRSVS